MKTTIKKFMRGMIDKLPLSNMIVFESAPDVTGNTKAVFDELIKRGLNSKYKMIWWLNASDRDQYLKLHNVYYISNKFTKSLVRCFTKLFISENMYFIKARTHGQYIMHMFHGAALKNVTRYYQMPNDIDEVISLSEYLLHEDAINNGCSESIIRPMGFPRNDILLGKKVRIDDLFPGYNYDKLIYWMPTYRQHQNKKVQHSDISIPIIHNEAAARMVNEYAKEKGVLIILKPHFAQDVSKLIDQKLSNIILISDSFLHQHNIANYELLKNVDALLTDYSSVYYDYLLTNRPIGLCWEDIKEYENNNGFIVDIDSVMIGGEKIYNVEDMIRFIGQIAAGEDTKKEDREKIRQMIFPAPKACTDDIADHVEKILEKL